MITVIQIFFIIFALFAWSRAILRLQKRDISVGEFVFWTIIWISVIMVSFFPEIVTNLSILAGIERGTDFLIYSGIILLFYMLFRLYVKVDNQNQDITKIVRQIAINKKKK